MLNVPLQVRLLSKTGALNITNRVLDDVTFSNSAPGGFKVASCSLSRPIDRAAVELAPYTGFEIVDTSSGQQLWLGRLEDPGKSSRGEVWQLNATGWSAHAQDRAQPVAYVDQRLDQLKPFQANLAGPGTMQVGPSDATSSYDDAALTFQFPRGAVVNNTRRLQMMLSTFATSGQHIALMRAMLTAGVAGGGNYFVDLVGRGGPATDAQVKTWTPVTGAPVAVTAVIGTDFATLHRMSELRMRWAGAVTTIGSDTVYALCSDFVTIGTRVDRFGAELVTAASYDASGVLPHEVVEDLLGRLLTELDAARSSIDTSLTTRVTQLSYEDSTTAQQVLEDLMTLYPTHYWAVWGGDATAQFKLAGYAGAIGGRLEWQPWPTTVSLEGLDTRLDDFDDSGSSADLYNEVTVRYKDAVGRSFSVTRTGESPALTAAGLTRRAFIDLGSQMGNAAQAASVGDVFLESHRYPSNGGTIKVRRALRDVVTGRLLRPRELRAGVLCRVANLSPQPDSVNFATTNGSTVFRVSDVAYSAKNDEATLTLDSYGRSVARQLAALSRRTARQRRL